MSSCRRNIYCPVLRHAELLGSEEMLCINCLMHLPLTMTWNDPYENDMAKMFWGRIPIERCAALILLQQPLQPQLHAIYQLKYHHRPDTGNYLGRLIGKQRPGSQTSFKDIDAIIPIPITRKDNRRPAAITRARK